MSTEPSGADHPDTVGAGAGSATTGQPETAERPAAGHPDEPHIEGLAERLNWLRAGVLGANDGIVSVAAVAVGVAAATSQTGPILTAGLAALVGGAISMALGATFALGSLLGTTAVG